VAYSEDLPDRFVFSFSFMGGILGWRGISWLLLINSSNKEYAELRTQYLL